MRSLHPRFSNEHTHRARGYIMHWMPRWKVLQRRDSRLPVVLRSGRRDTRRRQRDELRCVRSWSMGTYLSKWSALCNLRAWICDGDA